MATVPETTRTITNVPALPDIQDFPEADLRPEVYRIKAKAFEGETETIQAMSGVILAIRPSRWYAIDNDANPDERLTVCELADPAHGLWRLDPALREDSPTELRDCATCPMNRYRTASNGRGKACREKRLLLFLRDGEYLPIVVAAPPTSLRSVARFTTRAAARRLRLGQLHVRLAIDTQKRGQEEWGVLRIEELGLLDEAAQVDLAQRLQDGPLADMYRAWTAILAHTDRTL
ncbi:hypothetical protein Sulac_1106 [Sulfobacillus acidophilus DSM 10332]|uniref:Uncharacterized protein n=1 Tax=Sulfobacillus acidophilus (strain ATCC 700253 / DSM 10332 / NAL) TaxID=679936 RepID=G8TU15_SULAD|nr:hypothetical protein Sulac_1106 [Sulfobacillus acidophilus DSM 10332]